MDLTVHYSLMPRFHALHRMNIVILSKAAGLEDLLAAHYSSLGFSVKSVDYSKPLQPQIADAEVLVNGLGRIDASIVDSCAKLKLVHQIGTGTDNIDIDYCTSRSVHVAHVPKVNSVAVAEHTLFLMIYLAKNIKGAGKGLMQKRVLNVLGTELQGKTLLIIGLGYIGSEVAKRALAFGMNVIALTRHPERKLADLAYSAEPDGQVNHTGMMRVIGRDALADSLAKSDFVSLHTDLTPETRGMISAREFEQMRNNAFLINVARAQIVDRGALLNYLTEHKIAGAAFDVFWDEPANPDDPLLQLDNFVLTPHIAGWTRESSQHAIKIITCNIERLSKGILPLYLVNQVKSSVQPSSV